MRAAFDGDRLVDDVALAARGGRETDLQAAEPAGDAAVHDHLLGDHLALDRGGFADDEGVGSEMCIRDRVVGESATVKGEVIAEEVIVHGRVTGRLRGLKVRLSTSALSLIHI